MEKSLCDKRVRRQECQVRTALAALTLRTSLSIRFDAWASGGYSAGIILIQSKTLVSLDSNVKEMVVALGFRHKNRPVELRALGNAIDTTRRRATFRYAVRWVKTPSAALIDDMRLGMSPLRPTTQAYAGDVDFIDIRLELAPNAVRQPAEVVE